MNGITENSMVVNSHSSQSEGAIFDNLIWLNTAEASEYLRVSKAALRMRVHRGEVKFYKLGNHLRFRRDDLDELLKSSTTGD